MPNLTPMWKAIIGFNIMDFYNGNEYLYKKDDSKPYIHYISMCKILLYRIQDEIKWVLIHYLDPYSNIKDISNVELAYRVSDEVNKDTSIFIVEFTWRLKPINIFTSKNSNNYKNNKNNKNNKNKIIENAK
jgi:hypothetical protein